MLKGLSIDAPMARAVAAAALLIAVAGCRRHPAPPFLVDRFHIPPESISELANLDMSADQVERTITEALTRQGVQFVSGDGSGRTPPPFHLRAGIPFAHEVDEGFPQFDDGGTPHVMEVQLELEISHYSSDGTHQNPVESNGLHAGPERR